MTDLDTALRNDSAWRSLVEARLAQLRRFLAWAAAFESGDTETSLRFRNRPGLTFEERFAELGRINVTWWARTTRFDVLTRAGQLRVAGETYEPALAHLAGATGPKKGFEKIWGIKITRGNAERCEALLRKWSGCWDEVAGLADVQWPGEAYQPADFENALCVFQERPHSNCRTPPTSVDERIRRSSRRSCSPAALIPKQRRPAVRRKDERRVSPAGHRMCGGDTGRCCGSGNKTAYVRAAMRS